MPIKLWKIIDVEIDQKVTKNTLIYPETYTPRMVSISTAAFLLLLRRYVRHILSTIWYYQLDYLGVSGYLDK